MVNLKKCVSLFLVLFLLIGNSFVLAEETKTEITFENSLYVEAYSQTELTFTPADFPGVDCKRVVVLYKEDYNPGYGYIFLLVLNQSGTKAKAEATEKVKQFSFVTGVMENIYAEFEVTVDQSPIFLKKGESVTFEYSSGGEAWMYGNRFYATFDVDPLVFDESTFTQDTFAHLGITQYWGVKNSDSAWSSSGEIPSPCHRYCTIVEFGSKGNGIEIADQMARTPGITMVDFHGMSIDGGPDAKLVNETPDFFQVKELWEPKRIEVTGKASGQGDFSWWAGEKQAASRTVVVYELGDVNGDTKIDAKDALRVLKYAVSKCPIEEWEACAAEVDGKYGINAKDALEILKYSVKKITKFPIEEIVITPTDVTPTNQ